MMPGAGGGAVALPVLERDSWGSGSVFRIPNVRSLSTSEGRTGTP